MWRGSLSFETPMLWALGFLVTFLFGGLTGIILAAPPLDFHVSDSYFVVAHFHYVLFGTVVFAMFGGFYFWWPKMTGKMLDERLARSISGRCSLASTRRFWSSTGSASRACHACCRLSRRATASPP
jgi:heme/copper-type cytochrome/quinol oxidase subunit 1